MERLSRKDAASGTELAALSDAQKAAIAEARQVCEARTAERRIMHQSALATTFEPEARAELDRQLRRDLERFAETCDRKIAEIRNAAS